MVYSSRFVMSVLVDSKPQKELANGVVPIQFGREYALRFRNKNDRRAVVKFTIDGENVSGNGYIVPANSSIDILRHYAKDAAFRFVDLDSPEAVDHGKNGPNPDGVKGVIEAKFYLEKPYVPPVVPQPWIVEKHIHHHHYKKNKTWGDWNTEWPELKNPYVPPSNPGTWCGTTPPPATPATYGANSSVFPCMDIPKEIKCSVPPMSVPPMSPIQFGPAPAFSPIQFGTINESAPLSEGCTVEGGRSGQSFTSQHIDLESDYVLLKCVLKGLSNLPTHTPANETYCTNCGAKKARAADNFCGVCGRKF